MIKRIIALFIAIYYTVSGIIWLIDRSNDFTFDIDSAIQGNIVGNKVSNVNVWEMGTQFYNAERNDEYDVLEFVEYIQLMQCSGGNAQRDLFKDPQNKEVLDDYDFSRLIKNCAGILRLGAKPLLKLGSVPMKYSKSFESGEFSTNIYPPDDYNVYYKYIYALASALVEEFGKEEVISWRFGVMTEYENKNWFIAKSGDPSDSAEAFCKLYDYTVDALQKAIGEDVYVGAHSMTVTKGFWDEKIFIKHCAKGINYKTGKIGARLCYLSSSFYDTQPEKFTSGYTLPESIDYLRSCAEEYGLYNLDYGVDEGRILYGKTKGKDSDELISRTVGYTWQAAYDARIYTQMINNDIDYFSSWSYLSDGLFKGNPTVSYHVAKNVAKFKNANSVSVKKSKKGCIPGADINACAAFDNSAGTLHIMAYNFKNSLKYKRDTNLSFNVNVPQLSDGTVKITTYVIDDNCNFFDEWCEDRKAYNISNDCFSWSPDDGNVSMMTDENAKEIYNSLYDKYTECSRLVPVTKECEIKNSQLTLDITLEPNTVVFYEISR